MSTVKHLLIVDDDCDIRDLLFDFFSTRGYRVSKAESGKQMREEMARWSIDLVILDLMLPGEDGLSLCREIRDKSDIPIIMLTAVTGETDRIIGLEMGADDYMEKPFNPRELLARIKAVFRRLGNQDDQSGDPHIAQNRVFQFSGWRLDEGKRELRSPTKLVIPLSSGEFSLLVSFLEKPQTILSREDLVNITRGQEPAAFDRSIDIQVSRLRKKLSQEKQSEQPIKTVRGQGYIFTQKVSVSSNRVKR
ncbi:response regulator [Aestuariispira insulae]|uniref:Regulatory protein VirG n=1 Tax=Aestuariispira insulae TaxID=1461337 RepID=A0A3D9HNC9_9PROT|nr:response regulator [Aestuariispira insulae]RED50801.1 two-component system OmpR family response regulator [Aestuariispira insulae]